MAQTIKPLGNYVQYEPVYKDKVGDILLTSNAQEGERDFAETGLIKAVGPKVETVKVGDVVILDQFAIEPVYLDGDTLYLHKEDRLKGITNVD